MSHMRGCVKYWICKKGALPILFWSTELIVSNFQQLIDDMSNQKNVGELIEIRICIQCKLCIIYNYIAV